ncbi:MAG: InlB B-repeat-containing protein [Coriobacteriales bacterium]|nr:InlB B-repeat-containing protein [Coriobacteriales bacterium]
MSGYTSTTLTNGSNATFSTSSGTLPPNDGNIWTGLGSASVTQRVADSENDRTDFTRTIIVQGPASLAATYATGPSTGLAYPTGRWTNESLNVRAYPQQNTWGGDWRSAVYQGATKLGQSATNRGDYTHTISADYDNTVAGRLIDASDVNLTSNNPTATLRVDKTAPVPGATYDFGTGVFTNTSSDGLSGLYNADAPSAIANPVLTGSERNQLLVVPNGTYTDNAAGALAAGSAPGWTDFASASVSMPGRYDVWVRAWDNAGNSAVALPAAVKNVLIKSALTPAIAGYTGDAAIPANTLASDTWTNTDVFVEVTDNSAVPGAHWLAYLDHQGTSGTALWYAAGATPSAAAPPPAAAAVSKGYAAEGIHTAYGVMADGDNAAASELSARSSYVVKIDKTAPLASLTLALPDIRTFTDSPSRDVRPADAAASDAVKLAGGSYAEDISDPANVMSGIDSTKTMVAVVPTGTVPVPGDYVSLSAAAIPSSPPSVYYDVWATVTDVAGNVSAATLQLGHINHAGLDEIAVLNFSRGMNQGPIGTNDLAKYLSRVRAVWYGGGDIPVPDSSLPAALSLADPSERTAANSGAATGTSWPLRIQTPELGQNPNFPTVLTRNEATARVTWYDQGSGPDGPAYNTTSIFANDFAYGVRKANGSVADAVTDDVARALSRVIAYEGDGLPQATNTIIVDPAQRNAINTAIAARETGTFPLRFTEISDGRSVVVAVRLYDRLGPEVPPSGSPWIAASDFELYAGWALLDDAAAKGFSYVQARTATGAAVALSSVTVDTAERDAIRDVQAAGASALLPLTFSYTEGSTYSVTVNVRIYAPTPPQPPVPGPGETFIAADDFEYGIRHSDGSAADDLDEAVARQLSYARARSANGIPQPAANISADAAGLAAINAGIASESVGFYDLAFTESEGGKSVTVRVRLHDVVPATPPAGETYIAASDFEYGIDQADLSEDLARFLSRVRARDTSGIPQALSTISVDATELAALNAQRASGIPTTLPLTFSEPLGNRSVTVNVRLTDHGGPNVPLAGLSVINAYDFSYGCDEADLTEALSRLLAHVSARDKDGLPIALTDITADAGHLSAIVSAQHAGARGFYPLEFSTPDGTSTSITVTLRDHGGPPSPAGAAHIAANDFFVGIGELPITPAQAAAFAAADLRDAAGLPLDVSLITVDAAELAAINAATKAGERFQLTFEGPGPVFAVVTVTTKDSGGGGGRGTSGHVTANDFTYEITEETLNALISRTLADAEATDKDGHRIAQSLVTIDVAELAALVSAQKAHRMLTLPLTFYNGSGASATIQVTLVDTNTYYISYYSEGHTAGKVPPRSGHHYGDSTTIAGPGSLVRKGHTFQGWTTRQGSAKVSLEANAPYSVTRHLALYAVWTVNRYDVSYDAGTDDKVTGLPTGRSNVAFDASVTVKSAPKRTGYEFLGWRSSAGGTFQPKASFAMPDSDVVLTALWREVPDAPSAPEAAPGTPVAPSGPSWTPAGSGNTPASTGEPTGAAGATETPTASTDAPTSRPPATSTDDRNETQETQTPVVESPEAPVPLAAPDAASGSWSLFDLIATIAGLVALVACALRGLMRRRQDKTRAAAPLVVRAATSGEANRSTPPQSNASYGRSSDANAALRLPALIAAPVLSVISVVLFLFTQDMAAPMVMFDVFSALFAMLLVLSIVAACTVVRRKDDDRTSGTPQDSEPLTAES